MALRDALRYYCPEGVYFGSVRRRRSFARMCTPSLPDAFPHCSSHVDRSKVCISIDASLLLMPSTQHPDSASLNLCVSLPVPVRVFAVEGGVKTFGSGGPRFSDDSKPNLSKVRRQPGNTCPACVLVPSKSAHKGHALRSNTGHQRAYVSCSQ